MTEKDDIFRNNQKLSSCYNGGYAPPTWSEAPMTNCKNYKLCRVFYNIEDELTDIEKLVYYREPVNIAMFRKYNQTELDRTFDYKKGIYDKITRSKVTGPTPPNIMVYTPSRVQDYHNISFLLNSRYFLVVGLLQLANVYPLRNSLYHYNQLFELHLL